MSTCVHFNFMTPKGLNTTQSDEKKKRDRRAQKREKRVEENKKTDIALIVYVVYFQWQERRYLC